jgi:hypothetical protein
MSFNKFIYHFYIFLEVFILIAPIFFHILKFDLQNMFLCYIVSINIVFLIIYKPIFFLFKIIMLSFGTEFNNHYFIFSLIESIFFSVLLKFHLNIFILFSFFSFLLSIITLPYYLRNS